MPSDEIPSSNSRTSGLGRLVAPLAALAATIPADAQQPRPSPENMRALTPGLARYTDDVLFGEVWKRPGLSAHDRSLVTISALIAMGRTPQLKGHLGRGLDNGLTPTELSGIVTHLAFYSGWPTAVSAIEVADDVFRQRNIDTAALRNEVWTPLPIPASNAARAMLVNETVGATAPALADYTNGVLFNDLWRRPDLSPRDRSLVTIAALIATGESEQLPLHLIRGMENGLTRSEISEVVTHLAFYAGWPKAISATAVLTKVDQQAAPQASAAPVERLTVTPGGANPSLGPASNFTGQVHVDTAFRGTGDAGLTGARVTFEPGAHSNWHTHPLGQLLIVVKGRGWVQDEGGPVREIKEGDAVWTAPGVKHWHGATPTSAMTHFAVSEARDGTSVTWLEPVTDAQYRLGPTPARKDGARQ